MLMSEPAALRDKLATVRPTHVAVAYLGHGWKNFLDPKGLKEIVVSPTLGSFPGALRELLDEADKHDFDVYFQKDLHAKLFVGRDSCLIGSANLTNNGFNGGLNEAAVYLSDTASVQQAREVLSTFKEGAVTDRGRQRATIEALWKKWHKARRYGTQPNESGERPATSLADWSLGDERVLLVWYGMGGEMEFDQEVVRDHVPALGSTDPQEYFEDYLDFIEGDDVRVDDWMLCWAARMSDGYPDKTAKRELVWAQIDQLIPHGTTRSEAPYTLLAVTLPTDKERTPPFEIDEKVELLVDEMLNSDEFRQLRPESGKEWRVSDVLDVNRRFFEELQQRYREEVVYA